MKEKIKVEQYDQNSESKQSAQNSLGNCQLTNLGRRWFNKDKQYGSKL